MAELAAVNAGIITGIWNIEPLCLALFDYLLYRQTLTYQHWVGMLSLVLCAVLISLEGTPTQNPDIPESVKVPVWVPVLIGIASPFWFAVQGLFIKHLASEKIGFEAGTLTFSTAALICFFCLVFAVGFYWREVE